MWFAGIDWADRHHDTVVIDEAGRKVASLRVAHSRQGVRKLLAFLHEIGPVDQIACILETNHGLLITTLLEAGLPLSPVNPKTVDRHRRAWGAKTDLIDAYLLAKHGRAQLVDLRRLEPASPAVQELKALTRDQESLIERQTRLVNQLTACLKAYSPVALHLFTKVPQHWALVFLQTSPTAQEAMAASVEQRTAVLSQAGHTTAAKGAPKLFEALPQPHLTADAITTRTKSQLMLALVAQLLPVVEHIAAYEKPIADLFVTHADSTIFDSLPGAGKRLAPRLLAAWGEDRKRYADATSTQALAGTSPVPSESGNYSKVHQRYACSKPLRNALHQFAWPSPTQEPWAKDDYERKRTEGKSQSMAVRALANVWVRIIFAMWVKKESYQRTTFVAAQRRHASSVA